MPRGRPASYYVFAALDLIVGGFTLLCFWQADPRLAGRGSIPAELTDFLEQEIPGYTIYNIAGIVAGILLGAGLMVTGVALARSSRWGRTLALACSGLAILHHVLFIWFYLAVVDRAVGRYLVVYSREYFGSGVGEATPPFVWAGEYLAVLYHLLKVTVLTVTPPRTPSALGEGKG
jgi:hypothetical protein